MDEMIEQTTVIEMLPTVPEKTPAEWKSHWQKEIAASEKRLRIYKKQGVQVVQRYLDDRTGSRMNYTDGEMGSATLNLFHKNISTVMAMLYGSEPQIDISREHADPDDDVARVASLMYQRILQADVEPNGEDLSTVLKATLQDRLLPGLGTARVRYEMATSVELVFNPLTGIEEEIESIDYERACMDYIHWQDVLWGWGRTWKEIPWWGFRNWLTKEEVTERFGEKIADNITYKNQTSDGDGRSDYQQNPDEKDNIQKAEIWEIWSKKDKKVYWFSYGSDLILDIKDDPLRLDNFWPMPRPMIANPTTTMFLPKADFLFAQDLYNEIDILQNRIAIITRAIKVVGVYDKSAGDSAGRMLKEGMENDLIPVDNWAMFAEKGGLAGVMQWFPVQEIVGVLQTLQGVQASKMEQLYEITGMSDIMRGGNTDQYASGGTQALKAKMGSIGVQSLQDEFARFASDLEALKAEVISKHFSKESIVIQSNAGFLPEADKPIVSQALELMKSNDIKWRVNIRPESIAMVDYAQIKQERTDFLMAMAQFIQSASGAVSAIPGSLPILLELMKWTMAGFKGSEYLEGTLDQAIDMAKKSPQGDKPKEPSPEELRMQIEQMKLQGAQQKQQGELVKIQTKAQADMQTHQAKIQGEIYKMQVDAEKDQTIAESQAQIRLMEIAREMESSLAEIQATMNANITVEEAQARFDIASQEVNHEYDIESERYKHDLKMDEIYVQNRNRQD